MTAEDMDALTRNLRTKAAKVRALYNAGVAVAEIARYLSIDYAHAYMTLRRDGTLERTREKAEPGRYEGTVFLGIVDDRGRIILPHNARARYGILSEQPVICRVTSEGLVLQGSRALIEQIGFTMSP